MYLLPALATNTPTAARGFGIQCLHPKVQDLRSHPEGEEKARSRNSAHTQSKAPLGCTSMCRTTQTGPLIQPGATSGRMRNEGRSALQPRRPNQGHQLQISANAELCVRAARENQVTRERPMPLHRSQISRARHRQYGRCGRSPAGAMLRPLRAAQGRSRTLSVGTCAARQVGCVGVSMWVS